MRRTTFWSGLWPFVAEQVEEEAATRGVLDQLKLVDGNPSGLFMIDRELGARKFDASEE